ncbi:hypothetical protein OG734_01850 [Streptomyces sp. NBC_00576]|nr:hypothetical protein [Streptomyces sp. NBC_00576]WUB68931.1 hypothetical protein OG734_01850 [Streptomyces sp. NBC_00576]
MTSLDAHQTSPASGRTRGRPGPRRGTRTFSNTGSNCGESPRRPAVTTIDMGF